MSGIQISNHFFGFMFQTCRDSGFKFEINGIQDSDLALQGPIPAPGPSDPRNCGVSNKNETAKCKDFCANQINWSLRHCYCTT